MKPPENYQWPQLPPLPPPHQAALIRVAVTPPRSLARQQLRTALRQTLAAWSGRVPEQLPLHETQRGPIWRGQLAGHSLDISLSYSENDGWIGLLRGGSIGVDAMLIQPVAEAGAVAQMYLGPAALDGIQQSRNPAQAFALAWTSLEACLKCLKLGLTEWSETQSATFRNQAIESIFPDDRMVVTVVTSGSETDPLSQRERENARKIEFVAGVLKGFALLDRGEGVPLEKVGQQLPSRISK